MALAADLFCRTKSPMDHLQSSEQMLKGRDRQPHLSGVTLEQGVRLADSFPVKSKVERHSSTSLQSKDAVFQQKLSCPGNKLAQVDSQNFCI